MKCFAASGLGAAAGDGAASTAEHGVAVRGDARGAKRVAAWLAEVPRRVALALVRGYRLIVSPWLPPACRFHPSCSSYAHDALARHGLWRGGWLTVRRLSRCHPFHPGGHDPVPDAPHVLAPPAAVTCPHAPAGLKGSTLP